MARTVDDSLSQLINALWQDDGEWLSLTIVLIVLLANGCIKRVGRRDYEGVGGVIGELKERRRLPPKRTWVGFPVGGFHARFHDGVNYDK